MKKDFNLEISSDLDYEGMVVNIVYFPKPFDQEKETNKIVYKQETIAVLNQDRGMDNIEIKIYPPKDKNHWNFSYEKFMQILTKAKELLIQINRDQK